MFFSIRLRPHALRVGLILALFCTVAFARAGYLAVSSEPDPAPISRVDTPENRVAITFDVTWGEAQLSKILHLLEQEQVRATFFAGGSFLIEYPERIKAIVADGHEIGTLGQRIINLSALAEQEVRINLLAAQSTLEKALGMPVSYFRPPQGEATPSVVRAAREAKLRTITFSVDSGDTFGMNRDQIVRRVLRQVRKGDIVRFSASDFSPVTAEALPGIIQGLKQKGFSLVPVSELLPPTSPSTGESGS